MEWIKSIWNKSTNICKEYKIELPDFSEFWEKGYFEVPPSENKKIMFKNFRQNPITNPLKTPSGKIEISSRTIANFNLSDCHSHPKWLEPYEWLGKIDRYTLHLISNQPTHRLHSQLDNAISSQNE